MGQRLNLKCCSNNSTRPFGLFPTWESFVFQLAAAVFVIGSYYLAEYQHRHKRTQQTARHAEVTSQIVKTKKGAKKPQHPLGLSR